MLNHVPAQQGQKGQGYNQFDMFSEAVQKRKYMNGLKSELTMEAADRNNTIPAKRPNEA